MKSYAINFTCVHQDKSRSSPFRVYDFDDDMTAGQCFTQALKDLQETDPTISQAIINNMVAIP